MKSAKRFEIQSEKKSKKQTSIKNSGGRSRYAMKRDRQKRGFYSDTSPLRHGANAEE